MLWLHNDDALKGILTSHSRRIQKKELKLNCESLQWKMWLKQNDKAVNGGYKN